MSCREHQDDTGRKPDVFLLTGFTRRGEHRHFETLI
jgi:hypothetical protein